MKEDPINVGDDYHAYKRPPNDSRPSNTAPPPPELSLARAHPVVPLILDFAESLRSPTKPPDDSMSSSGQGKSKSDKDAEDMISSFFSTAAVSPGTVATRSSKGGSGATQPACAGSGQTRCPAAGTSWCTCPKT
jgi:hypothetical protein